MSIYSLHAQFFSRKKGDMALAKAAYRSGNRLTDERYGMVHDYSRKQGIADAFIMAPDSAPGWVYDRETLWNTVEETERRSNSQLARELMVALPHELSLEQNRKLLETFVAETLVSKGIAVDVAIHQPSRDGDQRNVHAHLMCTTRTLNEDGFNEKLREWNGRKNELDKERAQWAMTVNHELTRNGIEIGIDHRSLDEQREAAMIRGHFQEAQELDRAPAVHQGHKVSALLRRGEVDRPEVRLYQERTQRQEDRHQEQKKLRQEVSRIEYENAVEESQERDTALELKWYERLVATKSLSDLAPVIEEIEQEMEPLFDQYRAEQRRIYADLKRTADRQVQTYTQDQAEDEKRLKKYGDPSRMMNRIPGRKDEISRLSEVVQERRETIEELSKESRRYEKIAEMLERGDPHATQLMSPDDPRPEIPGLQWRREVRQMAGQLKVEQMGVDREKSRERTQERRNQRGGPSIG